MWKWLQNPWSYALISQEDTCQSLQTLHQHNDSEGFLCVGSPSDITLCNNVLNINTYMYSFYQQPYKVGISIIYNLNEKTDV